MTPELAAVLASVFVSVVGCGLLVAVMSELRR